MQNFRGKNIIMKKLKVAFAKLQGLKHNKNRTEGHNCKIIE
jgi:hypothetical protein